MIKRSKRWSKEETKVLIEYYPTHGGNYCLVMLKDRTLIQIQKKANYLGLKVNESVKVSNNKTAQLKFQDDRTDDSFNINVKQFLNIQTKEIPYILGFLWADGYVVRNEVRLEIVKDDLDVIKPILESIGKWTYTYRDREGCRTSGRATTSNIRLKDFLVKHDYNKKSYVSADKILSKIPDELKHYFFRGLIDGDGCIYVDTKKKKVSISGDYLQDWGFVEQVCEELNIIYGIYRTESERGNHSVIEINGTNGKVFCDYIYDGKIFGLNRKYNKYILLTEAYNNSPRKILNNKKEKALELYNKGISISKIVEEIEIPNTTLRRYLKTII